MSSLTSYLAKLMSFGLLFDKRYYVDSQRTHIHETHASDPYVKCISHDFLFNYHLILLLLLLLALTCFDTTHKEVHPAQVMNMQ